MPFVNEYILEEDFVRFDLRRICGEHNLRSRRGHMYARDWTIDRERDAFLIQVWSHHEADFGGWAFHLSGTWIFFEMQTIQFKRNVEPSDPKSQCWIRYGVKGFIVPDQLASTRADVVSIFHESLEKYCGGGVISTCTGCTANVEFMKE